MANFASESLAGFNRIAQIILAILLASAMAISIFGILASMRASHKPGRPPPRPFQ